LTPAKRFNANFFLAFAIESMLSEFRSFGEAGMDGDVDKLITGWFERARANQLTHDACGSRLTRWHYLLGLPLIALTTTVAAAIFYSLGRYDISDTFKMALGLVAGATALLACLQTFLGLAERADQHKIACARYDALRRSLEILKTFSPSDPIELRRAITDIQREMDRLAESSPAIPPRLKRKIDKKFENEGVERIFHLPERTESVKAA
jgi:hypothetical protein